MNGSGLFLLSVLVGRMFMTQKSLKVSHILIAFSFIFLALACVFLSIENNSVGMQLLIMSSIMFQVIMGALLIGISVGITRKASHLFMGLIFIGYGFMILLLNTCLPFSFRQFWPVFSLFTGISVLISSIFKYKSFKLGYGVLGIFFVGMGLWFGLFSFRIVKIPYKNVFSFVGPAFVIAVILLLIIFFFIQQKHKELIFRDDDVEKEYGALDSEF